MKLTNVQKMAEVAERLAAGCMDDYKWMLQDTLKRMYDADESLALYYELHDEGETVDESVNYLTDDEKSRWLVTFKNEDKKEEALTLFTSDERAAASNCSGNVTVWMRVRDIIDTILSSDEYDYVFINPIRDGEEYAMVPRDYLEEIAAQGEYRWYDPQYWGIRPGVTFSMTNTFLFKVEFYDEGVRNGTSGGVRLKRTMHLTLENAGKLQNAVRQASGDENLVDGVNHLFGVIRKGTNWYYGDELIKFCNENDVEFTLGDDYWLTRPCELTKGFYEYAASGLLALQAKGKHSNCTFFFPDDVELQEISFSRTGERNGLPTYEMRMLVYEGGSGDKFDVQTVTVGNLSLHEVLDALKGKLEDKSAA